MQNQEFLSELLALPPEAQTQVIRLIESLKEKYRDAESTSSSLSADLMDDEFIGMWRDRQDLGNRSWLRNLRENEWSKTHEWSIIVSQARGLCCDHRNKTLYFNLLEENQPEDIP
ncbi:MULTISPECIES: hypothetical protein [unclassified Roseofilum]|uniref:hypothetical protein n=1 Tax=unclassified Roseofilum TaxID=2620099 RepID=UPI001B140E39|nr:MULTISPECIES: hypothetical protein [unclassified Roseofilum]MBP0010563.1 hypothetical protein [Roseofilum sp. Belize Diploria]MBP0035009.1 hypothetical protein [Roseofilum sp. Belize BBD 4]